MKIKTLSLDKLYIDPANPRKISERAIEEVAASLREYGWQQPIVADDKGKIIAGHTRYHAAKKIGMPEAPVKVFEHSEIKAIKYNIADNRTHQFSEWADEELVRILEGIKAEDSLEGTGFNDGEFEAMIERLNSEEVADPLGEWQGMPEFEQESIPIRTIHLHFLSDEAVVEFAKLLEQTITDKTKYLYYPKLEPTNARLLHYDD